MKSESDPLPFRPTFSELLDYAEDRLDEAGQQRVADFLAEHPQAVAAEIAWIRDFLSKSRSAEFYPMPADLEDRLNGLYPAARGLDLLNKASGWMGAIRRVVADLVDPGLEPGLAAAGLRAQSFEQTARQIMFKTAQFDIWVNALDRRDRRFDLHGQIFTGCESDAAVTGSAQLLQEDREIGLATVDEFGEFLIHGIPAGEYTLIIAGQDTEVVCSPLRLDA
jgi:hypothetical protein